MYSLNIEIKVKISVETEFYSCNGDAVVIQGEYGTTREMYCGRSLRLHRIGPFCTRFKLSPLVFDSSGLSNGSFGLVGGSTQPRPWDDADPFYPRAVAVWDAQAANLKAQAFYLNIGFSIPTSGVFDEFKDGVSANIYTTPDESIGTAQLSIKKL